MSCTQDGVEWVAVGRAAKGDSWAMWRLTEGGLVVGGAVGIRADGSTGKTRERGRKNSSSSSSSGSNSSNIRGGRWTHASFDVRACAAKREGSRGNEEERKRDKIFAG